MFKKLVAFTIVLGTGIVSFAQNTDWYKISKDSSKIELTETGAYKLSLLPLKCLQQEFPNKTSHLSKSAEDHKLLPSEMHPAFYGCFDWHSSVHGHWMLIKLLKQFPDLKNAEQIRASISKNINIENIRKEVEYFYEPLNATWERTYGWAWILKLDEELQDWQDPDGQKWLTALRPLTQKVVDIWTGYLQKQTYPNRTGIHGNTAFGLGFALDYAKKTQNKNFEQRLILHSLKLFRDDKNAPASWEPDGVDFFSPSLMEADLMQRVLKPAEYNSWFNAFLPAASIKHLSILPEVSDRTDYQIIHLDGLCYSRAWTMMSISKNLPANAQSKPLLKRAAINHLATAIKHMSDGNYGGEHWLASFAVYAMTN